MTLTDNERQMLAYMRAEVARRGKANRVALSYYDASVLLKSMNIAVPPALSDMGVASDWPATIVDAYHERLSFLTWKSDKFDVGHYVTTHGAGPAVDEAALDSGVYGVGFLAVEKIGVGAAAKEWRVKPVSPLEGTLLWDYTSDRPLAGYRRVPKSFTGDGEGFEILYLPGRNITLRHNSRSGEMEEVAVDYTKSPAVAMQRVRSKARSRRYYGASMITPPVRYYTDAAMRTLLGMEINREFYTTPQRWAMNADMSMFLPNDNPTKAERIEAGWQATSGKMLAFPPPEEGEPEPKVGQFSAAPPTPYLEQLRGYSQLLASATGMPSAYLGFTTENPPSADAIRAWLERLVRSVLRQQRLITPDLRQVAWVLTSATLGYSVEWEEFAPSVVEKWENPATETLAADTDAVVKAISAGVTPPTSEWVFDRLRIPEDQREEIRAAQRVKEQQANLAQMLSQATPSVDDQAAAASNIAGAGEAS